MEMPYSISRIRTGGDDFKCSEGLCRSCGVVSESLG